MLVLWSLELAISGVYPVDPHPKGLPPLYSCDLMRGTFAGEGLRFTARTLRSLGRFPAMRHSPGLACMAVWRVLCSTTWS